MDKMDNKMDNRYLASSSMLEWKSCCFLSQTVLSFFFRFWYWVFNTENLHGHWKWPVNKENETSVHTTLNCIRLHSYYLQTVLGSNSNHGVTFMGVGGSSFGTGFRGSGWGFSCSVGVISATPTDWGYFFPHMNWKISRIVGPSPDTLDQTP